jgi:hypothetical protein
MFIIIEKAENSKIIETAEISEGDVSSAILEGTSEGDYLVMPDSFKADKYKISKRIMSGDVRFNWYTRLGGFEISKPKLPIKIKEKMR